VFKAVQSDSRCLTRSFEVLREFVPGNDSETDSFRGVLEVLKHDPTLGLFFGLWYLFEEKSGDFTSDGLILGTIFSGKNHGIDGLNMVQWIGLRWFNHEKWWCQLIYCWLVAKKHLEKYESQLGRIIPYIMENKKCSKPPTSNGIEFVCCLSVFNKHYMGMGQN